MNEPLLALPCRVTQETAEHHMKLDKEEERYRELKVEAKILLEDEFYSKGSLAMEYVIDELALMTDDACDSFIRDHTHAGYPDKTYANIDAILDMACNKYISDFLEERTRNLMEQQA